MQSPLKRTNHARFLTKLSSSPGFQSRQIGVDLGMSLYLVLCHYAIWALHETAEQESRRDEDAVEQETPLRENRRQGTGEQ